MDAVAYIPLTWERVPPARCGWRAWEHVPLGRGRAWWVASPCAVYMARTQAHRSRALRRARAAGVARPSGARVRAVGLGARPGGTRAGVARPSGARAGTGGHHAVYQARQLRGAGAVARPSGARVRAVGLGARPGGGRCGRGGWRLRVRWTWRGRGPAGAVPYTLMRRAYFRPAASPCAVYMARTQARRSRALRRARAAGVARPSGARVRTVGLGARPSGARAGVARPSGARAGGDGRPPCGVPGTAAPGRGAGVVGGVSVCGGHGADAGPPEPCPTAGTGAGGHTSDRRLRVRWTWRGWGHAGAVPYTLIRRGPAGAVPYTLMRRAYFRPAASPCAVYMARTQAHRSRALYPDAAGILPTGGVSVCGVHGTDAGPPEPCPTP